MKDRGHEVFPSLILMGDTEAEAYKHAAMAKYHTFTGKMGILIWEGPDDVAR